ncbi:hypothetical protein NDU88_004126 [Pleurodeles waltl]|uniref:Uncharacterized protein n=1 Tax=Pleurodeles waltl TaxID=8319 RepID=A0AAV7T6X8_PLEWA|nr:hypothetical protein NDU88_004126 [Pleurodeles waltl]
MVIPLVLFCHAHTRLSSQALPTKRVVESTFLSTFAALSHLQASVPPSAPQHRCPASGARTPPLWDLRSSDPPTRAVPRRDPTPALGAVGHSTTRRRRLPAVRLQTGASADTPALGLGPPARPAHCFHAARRPLQAPPEPSDGRASSSTVWESAAPPGSKRDQAWHTGL